MGEIRIVGPGKTRGYPYPVCKKNIIKARFYFFGVFLASKGPKYSELHSIRRCAVRRS